MKDSQGKFKQLNILYTHRTRGADVEGVHIRGISKAFSQLGHNVTFIAPPGTSSNFNNSDGENTYKYNYWTYFSRYCPQLLFEFFELVYNFYLYIRLWQENRSQHIDFIYERYALNTFATVLFGKRHKIPVILEVNDATGIPRVRKHKAEFIARKLEKWIFQNCTAIVTISSEFQRILWQRVTDKNKVTYVPNAVDPLIFNPDRYDKTIKLQLGLKGKITIGFIGSFANWHGVDLLLEVIPIVVNRNPNVNFLFVGSGVSLSGFKERIKKIGLINRVVFTGKVPFENIPEYLNAIDIGVIPHSNIYGSPMKLFEYMAMKVVPVVPNLPPILDVINDAFTGLIFQAKDAQSLAEQLVRISTNKLLMSQLGENARKQVLTKHSWVHNAEHVLNIYKSISAKEE